MQPAAQPILSSQARCSLAGAVPSKDARSGQPRPGRLGEDQPREGGELWVQVQGYVAPILGSRQAPVKSPLAEAEVEPRPETYPEHNESLPFQPKDTTIVTESKSPQGLGPSYLLHVKLCRDVGKRRGDPL